MFLRERAGFLYSPIAYYISKLFGSVPVLFIALNFYTVILYYSANLNDLYAYKIWVFLGINQLIGFGSTMYAYFLAALVKDPNALATANVVSIITTNLYFIL